jgi:hypothetical protein
MQPRDRWISLTPARAGKSRRQHPTPWYVAGLTVQCLLWTLVFMALVLVALGGLGLTEFRYVGF